MAKKTTVIRHTLEMDGTGLYLIIEALRFRAANVPDGSDVKADLDKMINVLTGDVV